MDFYFIIGSLIVFFALTYRFNVLRRRYMEPLFMGLMLFGIVALHQPVSFWLYSHGFSILFPSTLGYIFSIHLNY